MKKMSLPKQILIALLAGIVVGLACYFAGVADITTSYLKPFGDIFVNLLKFIVVPVVLFSMIDGILSMDDMKKYELEDTELDVVVGGYSVGDTVRCKSLTVQYCAGCGKLLMNYEATITGIRGELDGKTLYWITRKCCGHKTSVIETSIIG